MFRSIAAIARLGKINMADGQAPPHREFPVRRGRASLERRKGFPFQRACPSVGLSGAALERCCFPCDVPRRIPEKNIQGRDVLRPDGLKHSLVQFSKTASA